MTADVSPPTAAGDALPANPCVTSVSAFFPCYNDARTIATMVRDVHAALSTVVGDLEIIVVNDGSTDDSAKVLDALATEVPELRVVDHGRNRGYGAALISGFAASTKEWVFYTDGDAQYDATEVSILVRAVRPGIDVVQGYKISRGDGPVRHVVGRTYHHVVRLLFALQVRDTDCDFRLIRRAAMGPIELTSTSGVICVELMRSLQDVGASFVEVPVHHYPRPHGTSQFLRLPHLLRSARGLAALWVRVMRRRPTHGSVRAMPRTDRTIARADAGRETRDPGSGTGPGTGNQRTASRRRRT